MVVLMQMAIANYPGCLCLRLGCSGGRKALFLVIGLLDVGKGRAHSGCIWMSAWSDVLSIFFFSSTKRIQLVNYTHVKKRNKKIINLALITNLRLIYLRCLVQ